MTGGAGKKGLARGEGQGEGKRARRPNSAAPTDLAQGGCGGGGLWERCNMRALGEGRGYWANGGSTPAHLSGPLVDIQVGTTKLSRSDRNTTSGGG